MLVQLTDDLFIDDGFAIVERQRDGYMVTYAGMATIEIEGDAVAPFERLLDSGRSACQLSAGGHRNALVSIAPPGVFVIADARKEPPDGQ